MYLNLDTELNELLTGMGNFLQEVGQFQFLKGGGVLTCGGVGGKWVRTLRNVNPPRP